MVEQITAMHMSDGLVDLPTAVIFGAVAGLALAVTRARRDLDDRTAPMAGLVTTAFVAALVATVDASLAFVLEYAVGGAAGASLTTVFTLMTGLHALIGIGEVVITAATVGAVAAIRPDLVHLLRGTAAPLELRAAEGTGA